MKHPGLYVPLDVNYARDRAIASAGEAAELLYVRGLAYTKQTGSDGLIPDYDLDEVGKRLRKVDERVAALVREGLWMPVDGGWLVRNWSRWNESSDEMQAKRNRDAERQRRRRERARDTAETTLDVTPDVHRDTAVSPLAVTPPNRREEKRRQIPTTSGDQVAADVGALVAEFVDHCRERPPSSVVARIGREVKNLVADGTAPDAIRGGLSIVADRGLQPSALAGAVHEHLNARPRTPRTQNAQILDAAMERARAAEAQQDRRAIG